MNKIHITIQGKGGVGKSFVSALIAQYLRDKGRSLVAIDTDPVNATFSGYEALRAERLELMDGSKINERRFDQMMERLLTENTDFVVDNGASSFVPLSNYLIENQAADMIASTGKQLVVHTVVTGGQALLDTLHGLSSLAEQLPASATLVAWLNEYFGEIAHDGKTFEQMAVYQNNRERIGGIVRIARQTNDTFGKDVELMLDRKMTFAEVTTSPDFGIMSKQRLAMVKRAIFQQLDVVM